MIKIIILSNTNLIIITILIFIINLVFGTKYIDPIYLSNGLDETSLYGTNIVSNDKFILVSSNGYNIFNGAVTSYYNDLISENDNKLKFHSRIYPPEISNSNFGVKINIHNNILIISAIAHNIYTGIVYIYMLKYSKWILIQQLQPYDINYYTKVIGFGYNIAINDKYLAIGSTSGQIYLYWLNKNNYKFIGNIKGMEETKFGYKITFYDNILFVSLNNFYDTRSINQYNYPGIVLCYNLEKLFSLNNSIQNINYNNYNYQIKYTKDSSCRFFGSNIKILNDKLIISCSIPYPFYNFDTSNFKPKLIIYKIRYDKIEDNLEYNINQIITINENDIYFGTNFDFDLENLFVSGTNKIYQYKINTLETITYTQNNIYDIPKYIYNIPVNLVNNDYKVKITKNSVLVGSYGSNDLEGSLYWINYNNNQNNNDDDKTNTEKITSANKKNSLKSPVVFILTLCMLIFLTILTIIIIIGYLYYFYGYPNSNLINDKKKKKEEEEYSPYKVYSYLGYSESDEYEYQNNFNNNLPHSYVNLPIINIPFNSIKTTIQDTKKEKILYKSNNIEHIIGKEKVYSYKEYEFDEKNKKNKKNNQNDQNQNSKSQSESKLIEQIKNEYEIKYKPIMKKLKENN